MVSIPTNLPISSGNKYHTFHVTNKATGNKSISNKNTMVQFSSLIQTDTQLNLSDQNALFHFNQVSQENKNALIYNNRPISELSADEANDLIGNNGYFGVDKTAQRIIDFVMKGAGNDVDRLRAGREGILSGFAEAEKIWGAKLPDISYKTLEKSLEAIDEKIRASGGSVVDLST